MIIPEDYAKKQLVAYGLQVPEGSTVATAEEARAVAVRLGKPVVVKAVIPKGGRGKAGGVRMCSDPHQVQQTAASLIGNELLGHRVECVLVEEAMPVQQELYAACVTNQATGLVDLIVSFAGGMDIEEAARVDPGQILRFEIEPGEMVPVHRMMRWLKKASPREFDLKAVSHTLAMLHRAAADLDATLLEVNPLAALQDRSLAVLDCKLEVDDNSLARNPEMLSLYLQSLNQKELRARELGVSYVELSGNVGVITSGAGLGMATLDLLKGAGLMPANFLDTGGGISAALIQGSFELIMAPKEVRGAVINLYGGINRMLEAAKGIRNALPNIDGNRPVVVKILGNQQEEAWEMLEPEPNVHVIRVVQTEQAVNKLAELIG